MAACPAQQVRTAWFAHPDFKEGLSYALDHRKPHWSNPETEQTQEAEDSPAKPEEKLP